MTPVFFAKSTVVRTFFTPLLAFQAGFRFVAEFNFRALPFHIGQHELGVAKRAADEVLLAGLRVTDESRPAQHAQWDAALWIKTGLQCGFLAGGRRRTHVLRSEEHTS